MNTAFQQFNRLPQPEELVAAAPLEPDEIPELLALPLLAPTSLLELPLPLPRGGARTGR